MEPTEHKAEVQEAQEAHAAPHAAPHTAPAPEPKRRTGPLGARRRSASISAAAGPSEQFLQHLPVLEMPDVGHRLLRHALDLALLLRVGLDVRMRTSWSAGPRTPGSWRGRSRRRACPAGPSPRWPWRAPLPRARSGPSCLDLPANVEEGGAVQVRLGHGVERVLQLEDLHHHGVGVREEQSHLREEPPHVEVVGLLHHELGELQRAGADLGGHAHASLAAVRLEQPLRVVDQLEVRHGALAHGPLKLGRVHVG